MHKKKWKKVAEMQTIIICPYCLKAVPYSETNIEHILPRSRGGKTTPENTIRVCRTCNSKKGALTLQEFIEWKRLEFIRNGGLTR